MSAVTPSTNLKLLKVPIEIDDKNQINFATTSAQYTYFNSLPKLEEEGFTYQRKDSVIRYPANIDSIMEYNYVMYQNANYSDKWFYAFITNMEYISNGMTAITIKTDVYQTWLFDLTFKSSFVEREHVNDDTVGKHTIPENVELGDYVVNGTHNMTVYGTSYTDYYVVLGVTKYPGTTVSPGDNVGGAIYGGVYGGLSYITGEDYTGISNIIKSYNDVGGADSIKTVFLVPKDIVTISSWITVGGWSYNVKYGIISPSTAEWGASLTSWSKPTNLDTNYTPINKKLLTFPYTFLNVDNNVGNCITYKFEDFSGSSVSFDVMATITPSCSFKITPNSYKNQLSNYLYSFTPAKLPVCSWQSDVYTNWLTQNGVNIGLSLLSSTVQMVGGVALAGTGAGALTGASNITSGALGIANTIGQVYQHSLIPPSLEGNINSGDVSFASGLCNPIAYTMSIKKEYAQVIDSYFSAYGYKVNTYKIPNLTGRSNWNYVKTIDCNIVANIPQQDLQEIKDMFNKGVTIWHTTTHFLDYSQSNSIIT